MPAKKLLKYNVIDQNKYPGQGHIAYISKRHTNRRWRQFTPNPDCTIHLQLLKPAIVTWIELRGYGTYIVEIKFKGDDGKMITQLKYNLKFDDIQGINEQVMVSQQIKVRYIDVKLVNSPDNPQRMGLNHFFVKGWAETQTASSEQQSKVKKQPVRRNLVWKVEGQKKTLQQQEKFRWQWNEQKQDYEYKEMVGVVPKKRGNHNLKKPIQQTILIVRPDKKVQKLQKRALKQSLSDTKANLKQSYQDSQATETTGVKVEEEGQKQRVKIELIERLKNNVEGLRKAVMDN